MTIPPPSASDATASPASLKRESNICQSPPQNTSDRKSPHSINDAPARHGSTVLSTRVDWDLHEDDSDDDRMSEDELAEQHRVTNSGISSDGEDTALSDWETASRDHKITSRSTPHSVSYIGHLPIPRDEDYRSMASSSGQSRQPAFPGNREIMGGAYSQSLQLSRANHSGSISHSGAGIVHRSPSHRHRSPAASRSDYRDDRARNLGYHQRSPHLRERERERERAYSPTRNYAHYPTPYRSAYEQRSPRISKVVKTSMPDLVSKFAAFVPTVPQAKSNTSSPATSLSTLAPPTPPVQYSRMPHGHSRTEVYPVDRPRWRHNDHSSYRGVPVPYDELDELDELDPPSPKSSTSPGSSFASLTSTPSGELQPLPSTEPPKPARDKNAWKEHTEVENGPNGETLYHCMWTPPGGKVCGYTAKRHLVKRHVETRHLQIKEHICEYCNRPFPQRVSLRIHMNRHTGQKPHGCKYNCGKFFSDPARRHKHMVEVHGYLPQGPRKRPKPSADTSNSQFETLPPWTTKDIGRGQ